MRNNRYYIELAVILALLLGTAVYVTALGRHHVTMSASPRLVLVERPFNALAEWQDAGVHGRVLVLLDRELNADPDRQGNVQIPPSPQNYIYVAAHSGLVRRVFHVVPDTAWAEVENNLSRYPQAVRKGNTFRLAFGEAIPVVVSRLQDLPRIDEAVLLSINGAHFGEQPLSRVVKRFSDGSLASDLAVLSGPLSEISIQQMRSIYAHP